MTINLESCLFYRDGSETTRGYVGNDWLDGVTLRQVARYAFAAPASGARGVSFTLYSTRGDGDFIPLRFYIGTDPNSHVNAGENSEYTGELILGSDYMTFTGEAEESA
jgi:hypothetical protein